MAKEKAILSAPIPRAAEKRGVLAEQVQQLTSAAQERDALPKQAEQLTSAVQECDNIVFQLEARSFAKTLATESKSSI